MATTTFKGTLLVPCPATEQQQTQPWRPFETAELRFKRYVRSAAGSARPPPEHVRPPAVLLECSESLVRRCLSLRGEAGVVSFFLDRSRAIRQEFVLQTAWLEENPQDQGEAYRRSLRILARFLILVGGEREEEHAKHLDDALVSCLAVLEDEPEFAMYSELVFRTKRRMPSKLFTLASQGLWVQFFRHFDEATVLQQKAAARRLVPDLQLQSIQALNIALNGKFPVAFIRKLLRFQTDEEVVKVLKAIEAPVTLEDSGEFMVTLKKSNQVNVLDFISQASWKTPINPFLVKEDEDADIILTEIFR